jgi:hypothetical protein
MNAISEAFLNAVNHELDKLKSSWSVSEHPIENVPSMRIYDEDGEYITSLHPLKSIDDTATMINNCEKLFYKGHKQGIETGTKNTKKAFRQFLEIE